mmetsp:Transcript_7842/g.16156  ORF Transcript_7842/g.16156 Transcript_7842/m.16156 type:complete len:405 (-) Transcript_7842:729-1943(-)
MSNSIAAQNARSNGNPGIANVDRGHPGNTNAKTNPAHAMFAGYLAGSSGTIVGYPLDSLKVWVQTNTLGKNKHLEKKKKGRKHLSKDKSSKHGASGNISKKASEVSGARRSNSTTAITNARHSSSNSSSSNTSFSAARMIRKPALTVIRTVRALYSGVTGPLVTVGMVQSVNFATYDATRRFLYQRQHPGSGIVDREYLTRDSLRSVAMSGSVGGMATAVLTAPLLMMKINQQITGNSFRKAFGDIFLHPSSSSSSRFQPLRPYGWAFVPHAMSESIGRAIYVTVYEGSKRYLSNRSSEISGGGSTTGTSLSLRERMACAATSGIVTWATFFPLDALRNRMYHAASRRPGGSASLPETLRAMRKERAFYRGFSISILRAGPVAAAVLPVYDLTLEWLSSSSSPV